VTFETEKDKNDFLDKYYVSGILNWYRLYKGSIEPSDEYLVIKNRVC